MDPEVFFPEKGSNGREAKKTCKKCTVREACLEYALTHNENHGVWGGKTERQRYRMQRSSRGSR